MADETGSSPPHGGAAVSSSVPVAPVSEPSGLRQRKSHPQASHTLGSQPEQEPAAFENHKVESEATYGKTPSGVLFRVPSTVSFVTTLTTTFHRSSLTRWTFFSLIAQPILFFLLSNHRTLRSTFFLLYFVFWRGSYDFGFAWLLRKQSEKRYIVRWLRQKGWLEGSGANLPNDKKERKTNNTSGSQGRIEKEVEEGKEWARWWKRELEMKMNEGYKWEDCPDEFNSWLMFRQLVDVVLLNDFVSYSCFAWSNLHFPPNHSALLHVFRWTFGWGLIFFNLWVKMDAHRVVKDYAWYWGDAFWMLVMQHDLVFDGVYEIAPHPMYSVGYAGYYGLSMVVGSYTVLFVSIAAHAAQFAFLLWFENPHIERTYGGGKKPLASRVPLSFDHSTAASSAMAKEVSSETPAVTDGETEDESELPTADEAEHSSPRIRSASTYSSASHSSTPTSHSPSPRGKRRIQSGQLRSARAKSVTMHDLTHRFFRRPVVVLWRLDMFRATDFTLVVLLMYALTTLIPGLPYSVSLFAHFLHALAWRLFHSFGLGLLLRAQSKSKWLVRHYLKHYHYPSYLSGGDDEASSKEDVVKRATEEAFGNWQVGYNISLVMTYVSFAGLAWKTYHLPSDWTVSGTLLRHVLGLSLIALHFWSAMSIYEVLGDFGWLYSDFFLIEQIPSQLAYTGIYRFLNNPEQSMGGAAFFGLWLISNSKLVLTLAVVSHLSHWWFLSAVERPHMKRLYGDRLRKDGGLTKTVKNIAGRTLAQRAGKRVSEIRKVMQEVSGSIEKVEERVTEAVEEFLDHARPKFSDMVNDTKILLQQSRERMIFTRLASDISAYDASAYKMTLPSSSSAPSPRFRVGQPIRVSWTAPPNHSRKDWIGIYRLGSCNSTLVTRIASLGKWMPIYEGEYEGDQPVHRDEGDTQKKQDAGEVVFGGDQLPWTPGLYELRYHHDGKHNVMTRVAPVEIYVHQPIDVDTFSGAREALLDIVTLSLDSDDKLVPRASRRRSSARPAAPAISLNKNVLASAIAEEVEDGLTTPVVEKNRSAGHTSPVDGTDLGTTSRRHVPEGETGPEDRDQEMDSVIAVTEKDSDSDPERDPDDFTIMTETQAKRISALCELVFGVQLSTDVVVADANVAALTRRVLGARSLTRGLHSEDEGRGGGKGRRGSEAG